MNHQIKPNQSRIMVGKKVTFREIKAIEIDPENQKITSLNISNSISYLQKYLDFYEYEIFPLKENSADSIFVSADNDSVGNKESFTINGIIETFYGKAIVVKIPKSLDFEKLQSATATVEEVKAKITFSK